MVEEVKLNIVNDLINPFGLKIELSIVNDFINPTELEVELNIVTIINPLSWKSS